jgi:ABC-type glycerol-3-phosphate transport system substrate-binding protein
MKLRPFELVLIVVFVTLLIGALILLRTYKAPPDENASNLSGPVAIWGDLPGEAFNSLIRTIADKDEAFNKVTYRYIPTESFDDVFVNALADGNAPDLILITHEKLVKHRSRLQAINYETFPVRDFRNLYIDGAEIFALNDGLYGFPIAVDPLLMYWNRDMFSTNGLIAAPTTWETLVGETVPTLVLRNFNRDIQKAAVAMGEYSNVKNAFPLISTLLLQGGSALVEENRNSYRIKLDELVTQSPTKPFANAATFYTNFSNTTNTLYSWNRSLSLDRDMFLREDLAIYFGFASEGKELESKNPNLTFDVAPVPQGAAANVKRTYARFYSLSIPKAAKNQLSSYTAMQVIGGAANAKVLADSYNMTPAHRSTLQQGSNDVYGRVAYSSTAYARGWLNPDLVQLDSVLIKMLEDISANRRSITSAVGDTIGRIQQIY